MSPFIGRLKELQDLKNLLSKKTASLVVIKGRRRIGKSRLTEEYGRFFSKSYFFSGLPPTRGVTPEHQKEEFKRKMKEYGIPTLGGNDWGDLLHDVYQKCKRGRVLVVLDEISWLGMGDPPFLGKIKIAWDSYFKNNPQVVMVLSGSQSTWIEKNILNSSGFVGRISYQLTLEELSLGECNQFWHPREDSVSPYEKLKILAITGGVPRYLEEIKPHLSAEENIKTLCFSPEGLLFNEFEQIFSDLFSKRSQKYKRIVARLAEGPAVTEDICKALDRHKKGHSKGGDVSQYLEDLCKTGFVTRDYTWELHQAQFSKLSHYRLSDNYVRFYLKYIEPNKNKILSGVVNTLPSSWFEILGFQFENLVLNKKNRLYLFKLLGIPLHEIVLVNPFFQTKTESRRGCQIDLMIQTKFNTLFVCEIKFSKKEITEEVIDEVKKKIDRLHIPKGYSLRPVLVHVNGVNDSVLERDFFAHIIDFGQWLSPPPSRI